MTAAQERAILNSTLACLVKSLTNKKTTVELRNESFVTGKVFFNKLSLKYPEKYNIYR